MLKAVLERALFLSENVLEMMVSISSRAGSKLTYYNGLCQPGLQTSQEKGKAERSPSSARTAEDGRILKDAFFSS